jgi:single-strand DNA-binding protein
MATFNKVILMGRLTDNPEAPRTLPNSGNTVVKFRLAVGRSKKNQQTGQWENDPNPLYINCEVFTQAGSKRDLCNLVTQYVKKGDPLFVEGRLQLDQWLDKTTNQQRSMHKIVVESIELMGSGNRQGGGSMGGNDMGGMGGGDMGGMDDMPPPRSGGAGGGKPAGRGGFTPPPQNDGPDDGGDIPF